MANVTISTANFTFSGDDTVTTDAITLAERCIIPFICAFGLTGNTLSSVVFLNKTLRRKSSSMFLIARSISDTGFLITLLIVWFSSMFELRLGKLFGLCQTIIFFTYIFGCISVWPVVFLTAENFIRICRPFLVRATCKRKHAIKLMVTLLVCVLFCYSFPLWTFAEDCIPYAKYTYFIYMMIYIDFSLTLVIPTLIMTSLLVAMAITSVSTYRRRRRLSKTPQTPTYENPIRKVTTMLLAVTVIFFSLNLPAHIVRIRFLILTFVHGSGIKSTTEILIQSISQLFFYLSMAINVIIYYIFGSRFRNNFNNLFIRQKP